MNKLRSIQVLRGIAATAVVVHHSYRLVDANAPTRLGAAGVDLFFVISGFIMATIAADKRPLEFLRDRVWRIYPLWFIALAPWLLLQRHGWPTIVTSLTLWPIVAGHWTTPALMLGWTLCFEMLFYGAFAVALATRAAVPIGVFVLCILVGPRTELLAFLGSPMILEFLAGVCIAFVPQRRAFGLLLIPALAWFALSSPGHYTALFGHPGLARVIAWGIPAAMLVCAARASESLFERRPFDVPVLVGNASYSIYLFHLLVVGVVPWPHGVVAAVGLGIVIHWIVERRIIAAKPRLSHLNSSWKKPDGADAPPNTEVPPFA